MATIVTRNLGYRGGSAARMAFVGLVALAHVALLSLMVDASTRAWRVDPPSTPTIATWNILASDEAPPAPATPDAKASPIQINIDAPTIEVEEPAPIASGLGAALPIDPYAGAAPIRAGTVPLPSLLPPVSTPALKRKAPKPAGDDPYSRWVSELRTKLSATLAEETATLKPARAEVLAQPAGGFTAARITQGSGDLAIDRQILVDVMHHQGLIEHGMVAAPRWFALPALDFAPTPE